MRWGIFLFCVLALYALITLPGCGGGNRANSGDIVTPTYGTVTFTLDWPMRARTIPIETESIAIELSSGTTVLERRIIDRPATAGAMTVVFAQVPIGVIAYSAQVYTQPGERGTLIGVASDTISVQQNQDTPVTLEITIQGVAVSRVRINAPATDIKVGGTVQLTAGAEDATGQPVFAQLLWRTDNAGIANVDETGLVTGQQPGHVSITAYDPKSGNEDRVTISVAARMIIITVAPTSLHLSERETGKLTAVARDESDNVLIADFRWQSANPTVATVSADGTVTGVSAGSTEIVATDLISGQQSTPVTVAVTVPRPPPPPPPSVTGKIAFASDVSGTSRIYIMNADGSAFRQVTSGPGSDTDPVFSPDGNSIAYVSNGDGDDEIFLVSANGGTPQRLTDNTASDVDPAFSADGAKLVYASNIGGSYDLYLYDFVTQTTTQLTNDLYDDLHPALSPDGSLIVFSSARGADSDVYIMGADGTGITRLTTDPAWDGHPVFNPSGTKIAFTSRRAGDGTAYQTHLMNFDGSEQTRVLNVTHCSRTPCFSPDGRYIVCAANPERNFEIFIMQADGSVFFPVFTGPGREMHPVWSR